MEDLENIDSIGNVLFNGNDYLSMLIHFLINLVVVWAIIHFFYYKKSRRRDYYFTFVLISISIFLLVFLLGGIKLKIGFALGLFAIFGIIRYRTESIPVREMTYLFAIIAISVINALAISFDYIELITTNLLFIISIWICESNRWLKHVSCKLIHYDKIELIRPQRRDELIDDLKERTGLEILDVEIGSIDFLKDAAIIKVFYKPERNEVNTTDTLKKIPIEE